MHCFFSRLALPTIVLLLLINPVVAATSTTTTTTTALIPVFRANIKDVPGLHSGLTGVVYLYGVGNVDENESGGPKTAYTGYTSGLGGCTGENGCSIMVSPGAVCIHYMSRAPEYFDPAWENEKFWSNNEEEVDFSGMVESETISELQGKTVIIRKEGQRVGCGVLYAVPDSQLLSAEPQKSTTASQSSASDPNPNAEIIVAQVVGQIPSSMRRRKDEDKFCFVFTAVASSPSSSPSGVAVNSLAAACHSVNDCRLALLPGMSCKDTNTSTTVISNDYLLPLSTGYLSMDETGGETSSSSLVFTSCLATDGMDLVGSSIVLYSSNGIQLACGTIQQQQH